MAYKGIYQVRFDGTVSTAISLIQLKAGTGCPIEIIRAVITQNNVTTSGQTWAALVRKTATATMTAGYTPIKLQFTDPASKLVSGAQSVGTNATSEGTDGDILFGEGFNILNGYFHYPLPEERMLLDISEIIALKFLTAPPTAPYKAYIEWRELN